jgi:hypothetical protein
MAARTRKVTIGDEWRAKIQTTMLIKRLTDHASGDVELSPTQIKAIEVLLRKVAPDLQAVEHSGDIEHHYVAELPAVAANVDEWKQQHLPESLQ